MPLPNTVAVPGKALVSSSTFWGILTLIAANFSPQIAPIVQAVLSVLGLDPGITVVSFAIWLVGLLGGGGTALWGNITRKSVITSLFPPAA